MEITGKVTDGKVVFPPEVLENLGIKEGQSITLMYQQYEDIITSEEEKEKGQKLIFALNKYRTKDTPSVSLEEMEEGISEGASRGRFKQ